MSDNAALVDDVVAAIYDSESTGWLSYAGPPFSAAANSIGDFIDGGTFCTNTLVESQVEDWWENDNAGKHADTPDMSPALCLRTLPNVIDRIYDNADEAAWQIFSLTDSTGRTAFWAQWTHGSAWEGLDEHVLGGSTTLAGALRFVEQYCYPDSENLLRRYPTSLKRLPMRPAVNGRGAL
mgnify:CR=1 FL=1